MKRIILFMIFLLMIVPAFATANRPWSALTKINLTDATLTRGE